jgi:transcriptional regulator with XRE-family HTH domain
VTTAPQSELRVGSRLRARRLELGLTMAEVAERAGLTAGFISQLERDLTSASLCSGSVSATSSTTFPRDG